MADAAARGRIEALLGALHHYDPAQLVFQVGEIAGELTYLRHGVEVRESDVVLDVGANVGVAAVFFATHCRAGAVHSFEPVGPVFELLRRNVEGLEACSAHGYGMSAAPGRVPITFYPGAAAMSGTYADPERDRALTLTVLGNAGARAGEALEEAFGVRTLEAEMRTVSGFLEEQGLARVDLLKVDVERAELDVLAGVGEPDWPAIRQVVVEVHDEDGRALAIERMLAGRGFRVTVSQDEIMRGTSVRMIHATRGRAG